MSLCLCCFQLAAAVVMLPDMLSNHNFVSWQFKPYTYTPAVKSTFCFYEYRTRESLIHAASGSKAPIPAFKKNSISLLWLQLLQSAYQPWLMPLIKCSSVSPHWCVYVHACESLWKSTAFILIRPQMNWPKSWLINPNVCCRKYSKWYSSLLSLRPHCRLYIYCFWMQMQLGIYKRKAGLSGPAEYLALGLRKDEHLTEGKLSHGATLNWGASVKLNAIVPEPNELSLSQRAPIPAAFIISFT